MSKEKQIIEIKECIDAVYGADCAYFDVDGFAIANEVYNTGYRKQSKLTPCDCCKFNPPSSTDGKPCSVCPAQTKMKGGVG